MPIRCLFCCLLLALGSAAVAAPAPWYWWSSRADGQRTCSQTPLGPGWVREPLPFADAACRIRLEQG